MLSELGKDGGIPAPLRMILKAISK